MKKPVVVQEVAHYPTAELRVQAPAAGLESMTKILTGMVALLRRAMDVDNRPREWETPADVVTNGEVIRRLHEVAEGLLTDVVRGQDAGQRTEVDPMRLHDDRMSLADAIEVDNWLLYRARSWQHGHNLKRRHKDAGKTL